MYLKFTRLHRQNMKKFNFHFVVFAEKTGILPTMFYTLWRGRPYPEVTVAVLPSSLARVLSYVFGLLDLSTCVGLRYGRL